MNDISSFSLDTLDYLAFGTYFVVLCFIGFWVGRKEKSSSTEYFLAGRSLPWYVVGGSFVASNISTEHFIGMIGAAFVYGICVAMSEWGNVFSFSLLIWFFIPFLLAAKVFTTPEFLEKRFNSTIRQFFAIVTIISNVVAFLAAVLYGGGLALHKLFGWNLWFAIIALGLVAGSWAIYGGLKSVAWTDFFTVIIMICGGLMVTILGLYMLSGNSHSLVEGFRVMLERNSANEGLWSQVVERNAQNLVHLNSYNRLSVIQPMTHAVTPWPSLIFSIFSVSIWYNVINQFMIQRVLGAKNAYHARMGIVLAGYMKILMPAIVVLPGLILFAQYPEVMKLPWHEIRPQADRGYVHMLQMLVPAGLRGLFLAALFGAIQSTVNSVLNSTATIFTLDIYKRMFRKDAAEKHLVRMGMWSSMVILIISIVLARYIEKFGGSLFVYIQTLYAFFAPPFGAVFLLGILFRRINAKGATAAVFSGFGFGILMKAYIQFVPDHVHWLEPYAMQGIINWALCTIICIAVSLMTAKPRPEQITDQLTFNWRKLNICDGLGSTWYSNVVFWWSIFVLIIIVLVIIFSGLFL
ncbi:MAG: sodium:solute symporter family transporter [Planctomycetota bacterium]|jgi:SSS family solute:Na+ symporter